MKNPFFWLDEEKKIIGGTFHFISKKSKTIDSTFFHGLRRTIYCQKRGKRESKNKVVYNNLKKG